MVVNNDLAANYAYVEASAEVFLEMLNIPLIPLTQR